jgi:hypothetical protein
MSNEIDFRKYQLDAIARVFAIVGVQPAGPDDEQVVAYCRGYRIGEDGDHGRLGSTLARGSSDDDFAPF